MRFTIKDCLTLAAFDDAVCIAGKRSLDRAVRTVSVLESGDVSEIARYNEGEEQLMLSSFLSVKDDTEAQKAVIRELAGSGSVGLVLFHVEDVLGKVDDGVASYADELGFPLIVMPEKTQVRMGDVINEVTARVLWGEGDRGGDLMNNTISHLLNFEKYNSFQQAIRAAALANDFQMILLSENFNPVFSVETRHRATIADAIKLGKERPVDKPTEMYTQINVNGVITYWGPVQIQEESFFMFIVDNEDSYTAAEITKLAEIIELAMAMWKYTPERDVRSEFIKALRRGNTSLALTLKDEVDLGTQEIVSVFFAVENEKDAGREITKALEETEGLGTLYLSEEEETYGIITMPRGAKDGTRDLIRVYDSFKGRSDLILFHITGIEDVEGAAESYRLIGETSPFAKSVFPYKSVFSKYELSLISNCISLQLGNSGVKRTYLEFFEPFKKLGSNKRKQLMDTLETFVLDAGMNNAKTAEYMDIHTNTVQYRLKKIDDLMGAEITGNRVIPGLTISLALLRLERAVSK